MIKANPQQLALKSSLLSCLQTQKNLTFNVKLFPFNIKIPPSKVFIANLLALLLTQHHSVAQDDLKLKAILLFNLSNGGILDMSHQDQSLASLNF